MQYAYTEAATYQYNDEGIRTVKVVNGVRHEYDVVGGQINREVIPRLIPYGGGAFLRAPLDILPKICYNFAGNSLRAETIHNPERKTDYP